MLVSLIVAAGLVVLVPSAAHAAAAVQIDNVAFENSTFADGSRQSLHVHWSIPGEATSPVTLSLELPEELRGFSDSFDMVGPDGQRAGTCTVTADAVECIVDDAFVQDNPYGVSGEFWFDVQTQLKNKETEEHTFDFGEISQTVEVEANPNWCTDNCEFSGQGRGKWGSYNNADDTIVWTVQLPAPEQGIEEGQAITVTDLLDPAQFELIVDEAYPRVLEGRSLAYNSWDREVVAYSVKPAGEVSWSADHLTASFTSVAGAGQDADLGDGRRGTDGSFYQVQFKVKVLDEGKARRYTNSASYTIGDEETSTASGSATRHSGGATVVGRNFGRFQVTKALEGNTVLNPTFTVTFEAYDDDEMIGSGSFELRSGQSFISAEYFKGTRIVLTEVQPTDPDNVDWAAPVFLGPDGEEVTEVVFSAENGNLGHITEIRLVNDAMLKTGTFTARKVVENPDGVPLDISGYRLNWSREDGAAIGIPNIVGAGVTLPADGTAVEFTVPAGVAYSFWEGFVGAPDGTTWDEPIITVDGEVIEPITDLTILPVDGSIEIVVTNRITQDLGGFAITKSVSGEGESLVPEGTEFTVNYTYTEINGFPGGSGTLTVAAGETSPTISDIPAGATVTLEEVRPVDPIGGTWGEPQFDVAEFTVVHDQVIAVSLDNPISWNDGDFSVVKAVDGDGADLVAEDVAFGVDYTYTLPEALAADPGTGSGTLVVLNDGVAVTSDSLPYGTEVTLSEATPPDVSGGTWTGASFDEATFTIGDKSTFEVTLTNSIERDLGAFSIVKSVTGTGAHLVGEDTTFTVEYAYSAGPGFEAGSGSVEVGYGGEPTEVSALPAGAVVTLTEVEPDNPTGGTWQPAQFTDGNIVTIGKDHTVEVGLENTIDLNSGELSVVKDIEGTGASLVPDSAVFTVEYSYPAADGYEAGGGSFDVRADGTAATSGAIPYGAEVTLTEVLPLAVDGATWSGAEFSAQTVTIGDGTVVEVTLTNTIDKDEATTPEPEPDPTPGPKPDPKPNGHGGGPLAQTGAEATLLMAIAAALLLGGGLAVVASRQRWTKPSRP